MASRWVRNKNYSRATWRGSSPHLGSLKLTAKAPQNRSGPKRKGDFVFQPRIFRGKLAVSFREGIFWGAGITTFRLFHGEKKSKRSKPSNRKRARGHRFAWWMPPKLYFPAEVLSIGIARCPSVHEQIKQKVYIMDIFPKGRIPPKLYSFSISCGPKADEFNTSC